MCVYPYICFAEQSQGGIAPLLHLVVKIQTPFVQQLSHFTSCFTYGVLNATHFGVFSLCLRLWYLPHTSIYSGFFESKTIFRSVDALRYFIINVIWHPFSEHFIDHVSNFLIHFRVSFFSFFELLDKWGEDILLVFFHLFNRMLFSVWGNWNKVLRMFILLFIIITIIIFLGIMALWILSSSYKTSTLCDSFSTFLLVFVTLEFISLRMRSHSLLNPEGVVGGVIFREEVPLLFGFAAFAELMGAFPFKDIATGALFVVECPSLGPLTMSLSFSCIYLFCTRISAMLPTNCGMLLVKCHSFCLSDKPGTK